MTHPVDLLNNANRVFDNAKNKKILAANQETSFSIGENLSRLLSISEQQNDENKENGGSKESFFPQVSQASNISAGQAGPPSPGLLAALQPQMDPSQSFFTDPATGLLMPPLLMAVKSNDGEISILELMNNARNIEKTGAQPSNHETSPLGGEKLLSFIEQRNDENKENEGSNAAFLGQVSQASNTIAGN